MFKLNSSRGKFGKLVIGMIALPVLFFPSIQSVAQSTTEPVVSPYVLQIQINNAQLLIEKHNALIKIYESKIAGTTNTSDIARYQLIIDQSKQIIADQQALLFILQEGSGVPTIPPPTIPPPTIPPPTIPPPTIPPPTVPPATNSTALQNATTFNLVVSRVTLTGATCTPTCVPNTELEPNAVQTYSFSSSSGVIRMEYDVLNANKNIGHLTIEIKPSGVTLLNGLGGLIIRSPLYSQLTYSPPIPYWKGQFTDLTNWRKNNWNVSSSLSSWGSDQNIQVKASQLGASSPMKTNYIRVKYPKGSANNKSAPPMGGAQFYGAVVNTDAPVTLSFYILFPTDFPFTGGQRGTTIGKLPGMYGGIGNTGSNVPNGTDGWSTRYMWCSNSRETGQKFVAGGQLLQFTYLSDKGTYGTVNGIFAGCGKWSFANDGKWHNIQQTIHLNDVGKSNGRIDVCYDGVPVLSQQNVTFRTATSLKTNGILFQTFFGGGDKSYATPIDTYAEFADFALYLYPPTAAPGLCITNPQQ